jgi:hypothetical protein
MSLTAVVPAEVPSVKYAVDAYVQVCKQIKQLETAKERLGARILQGAPDPSETFREAGFLTNLTCVYSSPTRLKKGVLEILLDEKSPQWRAKNMTSNPQWALRTAGAGFDPNTLPPDFPDIPGDIGGDWSSFQGTQDARDRLRRVNAYVNTIPSIITAASL